MWAVAAANRTGVEALSMLGCAVDRPTAHVRDGQGLRYFRRYLFCIVPLLAINDTVATAYG